MKVLILGVAGLYGVHTVEELLGCPDVHKIYGIDDFSRGYPPEEDVLANPWGEKVQIIKERFQELTVKELNALNVDVVVHLAGYNSRKESMSIPEEYFFTNEQGTFQLMQKLLKTKNRPFLIYASTTEVYGEPVYTPIDEQHPVNPRNLYSVTKLAAEKHILAIARWCEYPAAVLRFTSTYGENQNICGYTSVVSSFVDRALRNEPLIIYGSGEQPRDFLYVKDAARAIKSSIVNRNSVNGAVINIATEKLTRIFELADIVKRLTGSSSEIIKLPVEKGEPKCVQVKAKLANKVLQWTPVFSLEQGLYRTLCWYRGLQSI